MLPNNLYSHNQAYTGKQLRHFPLNTVLAPPPATALSQDQLGSEAEEEEEEDASSSSDDEDASSSSESDSDDASEAGEEAFRKSPRNTRRSNAAPPPPPQPAKVEVVTEVKSEEDVKPKRRVDELRPHANCKNCQVDRRIIYIF